MCTPQSDGKRERLCFIERKDNSFVSNLRDFLRENILIFRSREGRNKNTGTFSRSAPCFSHRSPTSFPPLLASHIRLRRLCLVLPSRMTHAWGRAPAPCALSKFHFFAFTLTCNLLNYCSLGVKAFTFPRSAPEGEGSSPKPSPTKRCSSAICTHRVKR